MKREIDIFNIEPTKVSRDLKGKYILLYGEEKSGKTTFGSQMPRNLFLCFENGLNAISGAKGVYIFNWTDMFKILRQLRDPKAREMYDTVTIDTVTIAWNLCEKYICQRENVSSIRDVAWG